MMAPTRVGQWTDLPCSSSSTTSAPGHIDIVVVYKVDRLTWSLADFAKLDRAV